LSQKFNK